MGEKTNETSAPQQVGNSWYPTQHPAREWSAYREGDAVATEASWSSTLLSGEGLSASGRPYGEGVGKESIKVECYFFDLVTLVKKNRVQLQRLGFDLISLVFFCF